MAAAPRDSHLYKRMSGLGISATPPGPPFLLSKGGEEEEEKEATDGSSGNEQEGVSPASLTAGSLEGTGREVTTRAITGVVSEPSGPGFSAIAGQPSGQLGRPPPTPTSVPASARTDHEEARDVARSPRTADIQDLPASPTQRARNSPTAFLPRSPRSFFSPSQRAVRPQTPPNYAQSPYPSASQLAVYEGQGGTHSGAAHSMPPAYYALLRAERRLQTAVARLVESRKTATHSSTSGTDNAPAEAAVGSVPQTPSRRSRLARAFSPASNDSPSLPVSVPGSPSASQSPRTARQVHLSPTSHRRGSARSIFSFGNGAAANSPSASPSSAHSPAFARSPSLAAPGTPPRSERSWSSALHAILSPSPTLPQHRSGSPDLPASRGFRDAAAAADDAELWLWHSVQAPELARKVQSDYLQALSSVAGHFGISKTEIEGGAQELDNLRLREPVLFLAQAVASGAAAIAAGVLSEESTSRAKALTDAYSAVWRRVGASGGNCQSESGPATKEGECPEGKLDTAEVLLRSLAKPPSREERPQPDASPPEEDVFGVPLRKPAGSPSRDEESDVATLASLLPALIQADSAFRQAILAQDAVARLKRREERIERRLVRMRKASRLWQLDLPASALEASLGLLSSHELFAYSLERALREGLYSEEDIESLEPRLLLTLPRLAALYGVRESQFPVLALRQPAPTGTATGEEHEFSSSPPPPQVLLLPLQVFLPRICRTLPLDVIEQIQQMSDAGMLALARRLSVLDESEGEVAAEQKSDCSAALVSGDAGEIVHRHDVVFRCIASASDSSISGTPGNRAGSANPSNTKLMKRILLVHIARARGEDAAALEADDEVVVCKSLLSAADL